MSERKPCTRCARAIDEWSKICPFCNWDQTQPVPAVEPPKPAAVANYRPPQEFDLKKNAAFAAIGILALVAAFGVGMLINQDGAPDQAPLTVEEQQEQEAAQKKAGPVKRADTPLVPTNEAGGIEQPVTSAPVAAQPGMAPNDYQRTDATAVSSTEYAEIAKRARAEKERLARVVDPRSLTGPAYAQQPAAPRPQRRVAPIQNAQRTPPPPIPGAEPAQAPPAQAPQAPAAQRAEGGRTRPVPEYQPQPRMNARGSARLNLMIGADGRVQRVSIERPVAGATGQLIAAVQKWRFKPATENGQPVAAQYTVEISFDR
ncbi:MAG TPA: TonB family protein [Thermoanaerobaculia bacterium]|nr:TonB family protein [Thermoanaerobaculia bacterium]